MDRDNLANEVSNKESRLTEAFVKNQELVKLGQDLSDKMRGTSCVFSPPLPSPDEYFNLTCSFSFS